MKKIKILKTIILATLTTSLLLWSALPIFSSTSFLTEKFSPELHWKMIKTKHFRIYFHQGLEEIAEKMRIISEDVHNDLSPKIKWKPFLRTDIVLVDNTDQANGYATPFPWNRVQIYISRPSLDSVLNNFDDWLKLVFTHEYTHTLNLDTITGIPSVSRVMPGRCCFPNIFQPIWLIEGNAVYHESSRKPFGRNNSTYTHMIMRTEVFSDTIKSINEASHYPRVWPAGRIPYLYGGMFIEYLEKKYGTGKAAEVFLENSDNLIPYLINMNADDVYGRSFISLWNEWIVYIKKKYGLQIDNLKSKKLSEYKVVSSGENNSLLPVFSKDGKTIYYVSLSSRTKGKLLKHELSTGKKTELCEVNYPSSLSISANSTLYFTDLEYYSSYSLYKEIFIIKDGKQQLSDKLRSSYIDASSNKNRTVYITSNHNHYSLVISDLLLKKKNIIINNSNLQLSFPKLSPNGKNLIFTAKDSEGSTNLILLNIKEKIFQSILKGQFNILHPAWHPDGNRILISTDKNSVYNLYEIDLKSGRLSRLTNVIGGAFHPGISPDGNKIVFSSYRSKGMDVSIMEYPVYRTSEFIEFTALDSSSFKADQEKNKLQKEYPDYSAMYSVFPSVIFPLLPVFKTEEVYPDKYDGVWGFITLGWDALYRHRYYFSGEAYPYQKRMTITANYTYSGFYPDISIEYTDENLFWDKDRFPWEDKNNNSLRRNIERKGTITVSLPFIKTNHMNIFLLSYIFEKNFIDIYSPGYVPVHDELLLSRINFSYGFSSTKYYSYSISEEDGRSIYFITDIFHQKLGSQMTFYKGRVEYSEFFRGFTKNNVLMTRLRGGLSIDNPSYLDPYQLGRFKKGDTGIPETGEDSWGLRGYPAGTIYGSRILTFTSEYRFPLLQKDIGFRTFPLLLKDIWLVIFGEYGNVWNSKTSLKKFKSSTGAELHVTITIGYALNLSGYIGYSRGFNKYGENQIYFAVSTLLEGTAKSSLKKLEI